MNNLLQLKGKFESRPNSQRPGPRKLPRNSYVSLDEISTFREELFAIYNIWAKDIRFGGAIISVHYKGIVAKSNRISGLLKGNSTIVGAKFDDSQKKHIFTHFVKLPQLKKDIENLILCEKIVSSFPGGVITSEDIDKINNGSIDIGIRGFKTTFVNIVCDCHHIESFDIDSKKYDSEGDMIVTLYRTSLTAKEVLKTLGITIFDANMLDENTVMLRKKDFEILVNEAPYLISMQTEDLSKLVINDIINDPSKPTISIKKPSNEPIIGVIDTLFDNRVYFNDWVESHRLVSPDIEVEPSDYIHGTEVSSIIVDGPSFNPELDDGCGNFRVRHFGVATSKKFSSFTILKAIRTIVANNKDIKVWNLSLGSAFEINANFISPEAAELDRIQCENDCIFIVAGTNKNSFTKSIKIGAPADSLNSLVVNSVSFDGKPAPYTRTGPVLSFFQKPDVAFYGGDDRKPINVCSPLGECKVCGTSFAAPWIARKMGYLIYKLGFSREIAKALIIDSATKWSCVVSPETGYGIVPIHIKDVVESPNDEIKFFLTGNATEYETYTYNIPVPKENKKHPFFARATMCYFPRCSRNQGVDYTNTEVDLHFGRVKEKEDSKICIKPINANKQDVDGVYTYEPLARQLFRKWDNIKHISENINTNKAPRPREVYGEGLWGIKVNVKERLRNSMDSNMQFGVVITLKEMYGMNRIQDFIDSCRLKGWIVNKIEIDNMIDIYNTAEQEIDWK